MEAKDFAKVAYPCLNVRAHGSIAKSLGFQPDQVQQPLLAVIGEAGAASPLILLVAMLEEAKPGDNILVASYGNGAEALFFKVTDEIEKVGPRRGVGKHLSVKKPLANYARYLEWRHLLTTPSPPGKRSLGL